MKYLHEKLRGLAFQDIRRMVFVFFVLLYIAVCPLILLYAFGYIFQPQEQKLVRTGLVSVATMPPGADIYLGHSKFAKRSPAVITELMPGYYTLRVSLKNYRPFTRGFFIKPGFATNFDKLLLIPSALPLRKIGQDTFGEILGPDQAPFFILNKGSRFLRDFYLFDTKKETIWPMEDIVPAGKAKVLDLFWMERSPLIAVKLLFEGKKRYFMVNAGNETANEISETILNDPDDISWSSDGSMIFLEKARSISAIKPQSGFIYPDLYQNVLGFGTDNKRIFVLKNTGALSVSGIDGNGAQDLLEAPKGSDIFDLSDFYSIDIIKPDTMIFWSQKGALLTNYGPHRACPAGCLGYAYDRTSRRLLFWTRKRISVLTFLQAVRGPGLFDKVCIIQDVYEQGKDIQQCFWVYDGSHILFKDSADILLLGPDIEKRPGPQSLAQAKKNSRIYYLEQNGTAYFLDDRQNRIAALKIWKGSSFAPVPGDAAEEAGG